MSNRLPDVHPYIVDAIVDELISHEGMQRPPVQAAKLLEFVVRLHWAKLPFPRRKAVADHLGISMATIDAVRSHRLATEHLTEVVETTTGTTKSRPSIHRVRYIVPSKELMNIVAKADKRLG
jgi:hypothetical protein